MTLLINRLQVIDLREGQLFVFRDRDGFIAFGRLDGSGELAEPVRPDDFGSLFETLAAIYDGELLRFGEFRESALEGTDRRPGFIFTPFDDSVRYFDNDLRGRLAFDFDSAEDADDFAAVLDQVIDAIYGFDFVNAVLPPVTPAEVVLLTRSFEDPDGPGAIGANQLVSGLDGAPQVSAVPGIGATARDGVAFDADHDGDLDIAIVTTNQAQPLEILINTGTGFTAEDVDLPVDLGITLNPSLSVAAGDFTGDGVEDLLVGNRNSTLDLLVNAADGGQPGSFVVESRTVINTPGSSDDVRAIEVADIDGDNDLDAVALIVDSAAVLFLINDGSGSFTQRRVSGDTIDAVLPFAFQLALIDVDGDGIKDAVLSNNQSRSAANVVSGADGTLFEFGPAGGGTAFGVGDLDGDSIDDLVVGTNEPGGGTLPGLSVLFGTESGLSSTPQSISNSGIGGDAFVDIDLADLDGDGDLDIAAAGVDLSGDTPGQALFFATGPDAASFAPISFDTAVNPRSLVAADFFPGTLDAETLF
ncbi:MAG: FG-GAP repeat domain-containing protein [Pikeienuella sp.]